MNKKILLTRSREESGNEFTELEKYGAKLIYFPTIEATEIISDEFDDQLQKLNQLDYIIFTSKNSVKFFIKRFKDLSIGFDFTKIRIIATGDKTAENLNNYGIKNVRVPQTYSAEGILEMLKEESLFGKKIFLPSSLIARKELYDGLCKKGADIINIPIYNVGIPLNINLHPDLKIIERNDIDIFAFTSPSSYLNFIKIFKIKNVETFFKNKLLAAIGNTTASAIEASGIKPNIIPTKYNVKSLAESIKVIISDRETGV